MTLNMTGINEDSTKEMADVTQVDLTKIVYIVFYQTQKRTVYSHFTGEDAQEKAMAEASRLSKRISRKVAVFGPQIAVYAPPAPAEATEETLDFAS